MAKFFKKELPEVAVRTDSGHPIKFEFVDRGYGYLKTNDGYLIAQLEMLRASGRGGVTEIDEAEYHEFLKKKNARASGPPPRQRSAIGPTPLSQRSGRNVAGRDSVLGVTPNGRPVTGAATEQIPEPLKATDEFVIPRVGTIHQNDSA